MCHNEKQLIDKPNNQDDSLNFDILLNDNGMKQVNSIVIDAAAFKEAQRSDPDLYPLFDRAVIETEIGDFPHCLYVKNDILMRKFGHPHTPADQTGQNINQIVVPSRFRDQIIEIAHDLSGGHLGVNKTSYRILRCFFLAQVTEICSILLQNLS